MLNRLCFLRLQCRLRLLNALVCELIALTPQLLPRAHVCCKLARVGLLVDMIGAAFRRRVQGELEWRLRQVDGVEDVRGLNVRTRQIMMGLNEGFPKWEALFRNQDTINYAVNELVTLEYVDVGCQIVT